MPAQWAALTGHPPFAVRRWQRRADRAAERKKKKKQERKEFDAYWREVKAGNVPVATELDVADPASEQAGPKPPSQQEDAWSAWAGL